MTSNVSFLVTRLSVLMEVMLVCFDGEGWLSLDCSREQIMQQTHYWDTPLMLIEESAFYSPLRCFHMSVSGSQN